MLQCVIEDGGGEDGDLPVIHVDDREFTWEQFGGIRLTYAGWGMRIVFVPDDELERTPKVVVRGGGGVKSAGTPPTRCWTRESLQETVLLSDSKSIAIVVSAGPPF